MVADIMLFGNSVSRIPGLFYHLNIFALEGGGGNDNRGRARSVKVEGHRRNRCFSRSGIPASRLHGAVGGFRRQHIRIRAVPYARDEEALVPDKAAGLCPGALCRLQVLDDGILAPFPPLRRRPLLMACFAANGIGIGRHGLLEVNIGASITVWCMVARPPVAGFA